ncbi:PQQ-binding-like beta-propeller repeat protein, partial [Streptomyces sp. P17]|uniref:outer membrane protein assembly factor BamB family protein n=1 Tax=Streptomyces sp. P17 TaxID=3074716 RepID=UPI0028F40849
ANGRVGVLVVDRGFQAWEETIATPKGSTDLSRLVDVDAKPIVVAGTIYSIAYNGELFALDLRSGQQLWKRDYASFRNMAVSGTVLYL